MYDNIVNINPDATKMQKDSMLLLLKALGDKKIDYQLPVNYIPTNVASNQDLIKALEYDARKPNILAGWKCATFAIFIGCASILSFYKKTEASKTQSDAHDHDDEISKNKSNNEQDNEQVAVTE